MPHIEVKVFFLKMPLVKSDSSIFFIFLPLSNLGWVGGSQPALRPVRGGHLPRILKTVLSISLYSFQLQIRLAPFPSVTFHSCHYRRLHFRVIAARSLPSAPPPPLRVPNRGKSWWVFGSKSPGVWTFFFGDRDGWIYEWVDG